MPGGEGGVKCSEEPRWFAIEHCTGRAASRSSNSPASLSYLLRSPALPRCACGQDIASFLERNFCGQ